MFILCNVMTFANSIYRSDPSHPNKNTTMFEVEILMLYLPYMMRKYQSCETYNSM